MQHFVTDPLRENTTVLGLAVIDASIESDGPPSDPVQLTDRGLIPQPVTEGETPEIVFNLSGPVQIIDVAAALASGDFDTGVQSDGRLAAPPAPFIPKSGLGERDGDAVRQRRA